MSFFNTVRKLDLITLCNDLRLVFPQNPKNADLIKLVSESENYEDDFDKGRLEVIVTERNEKEAERKQQVQAEREERRLKSRKIRKITRSRERYELRKLVLQSKLENSHSDSSSSSSSKQQDLLKLMVHFDSMGVKHLFGIIWMNVVKENWVYAAVKF